MVLKFLGLGKKSEYFVEAEPSSTNGSEPPKATSAAEVKAPEAADTENSNAVVPAPQAAAANSNAAGNSKKVKAENTAGNSRKVKTEAETASVAATPTAPISSATPSQPAVKNFATDHLMPMPTSRRRPGPSLNPFKDMAKQVKTPGQ